MLLVLEREVARDQGQARTWALELGTGPWAQGPYGDAGTPRMLEILPPPSQPVPRGRDKPVGATPHWEWKV